MTEFEELRARLSTNRRDHERAREQLLDSRERLAAIRSRIERFRRQGRVSGSEGNWEARDGDPESLQLIQAWTEESLRHQGAQSSLGQLAVTGDELANAWSQQNDPRDKIEVLDRDIPLLLFPVRMEVKFHLTPQSSELWIRLYPDDVAVETHEAGLTRVEVQAGRSFWNESWRSAGNEARRRAAWRALASDFGTERAGWIVRETRPTNDESRPTEEQESDAPLPVDPVFPDPLLREADWTTAPRSRVMPDRFWVGLYREGSLVHEGLGNRIPDPVVVGPDPLQLEQQLQQEGAQLRVDGAMEWMVDFERAVQDGLALRIPISTADATAGFDRVLAIGLRLRSDAKESQELLEGLLQGHQYTEGLGLIPQGTATNNTDATASGYDSVGMEADEGFDLLVAEESATAKDSEHEKSDIQRLAEALGIDGASLAQVEHGSLRDLSEEESMNRALWRGTGGDYLLQMLASGIDAADERVVRRFFTRHVHAQGTLPVLRIGRQPYGVLTTADFGRWNLTPEDQEAGLEKAWKIIQRFDEAFELLSADVAHLGKSGDPAQNLLDVLGLHSGSVEFHRRWGLGPDYIHNLLAFAGAAAASMTFHGFLNQAAGQLLQDLGFPFEEGAELPRILKLSFFREQMGVAGPLVVPGPTSATDPLPDLEGFEANYLQWLREATVDDLREEPFGLDGQGQSRPAPSALLYLLLRHSLTNEFWDATARIHLKSNSVAKADVDALQLDSEFYNVAVPKQATKWDLFEVPAGDTTQQLKVKDFLSQPELIPVDFTETAELFEVQRAIDELKGLPTERLERLLTQHIDLCSYRLDAWQQGFLHRRLLEARHGTSNADQPSRRGPKQGIQLGAFGWLENLKPRAPGLLVSESDPAAVALGGAESLPGRGPLVERRAAGGYVHAPSMDHAKAAAVLRAGYLSHATPEDRQRLSVNLSSDRVRRALALQEGVRHGQPLGALLGYQLERGLHEREIGLQLNAYLLALRSKFPLINPLHSSGQSVDPEAAEVTVDGVALLESHEKEGYPYSIAELPAAPDPAAAAIEEEVERLRETLDGVKDLGLAEGVYQVVRGNWERAAAVLDATSQGTSPPEPEVVQIPRGGAVQTHRLAVILSASDVNLGAWASLAPSARSTLDPQLNLWVASHLGPPDQTQVTVRFVDGQGSIDHATTVNLLELGLQPLDLVLLTGQSDEEASALEARIVHAATEKTGAQSSLKSEVLWRDRTGFPSQNVKTFFECRALWGALRNLMTHSRPANARDLVAPSEAGTVISAGNVDLGDLQGRVTDAIGALQQLSSDLSAAREPLVAGSSTSAQEKLVSSLLWRATLLAIPEAVPESLDPQELTLRAERTLGVLSDRIQRAQAGMLGPPDEDLDAAVERFREAGRTALGRSVPVLPRFMAQDPVELQAALGQSSDLLAEAPPLAVDEWLQGLARVREGVARFETVRLVADVLGDVHPSPRPAQVPFRSGARWLALPHASEEVPQEESLCLVLQASPSLPVDQPLVGLVVDEWNEVIPDPQVATGIAFHMDHPDSQPPQSLLLALPASLGGVWTWDELTETLSQTLAAARKRAVEPDQLGKTPLTQLLPAIIPAVTQTQSTFSMNLMWNAISKIAFVLNSEEANGGDP